MGSLHSRKECPNVPQLIHSIVGYNYGIDLDFRLDPKKESTAPHRMESKQRTIALPPPVWGPIFWNTFHIVALGYPLLPKEADKEGAAAFYRSYQTVIPCPICREHYKTHLQELPVEEALGNRSDLIQWTWTIHNRVNTELGKPTITMDAFLDHIGSLQPPSTYSSSDMTAVGKNVSLVLSGILLGVGGYYLYKQYRQN